MALPGDDVGPQPTFVDPFGCWSLPAEAGQQSLLLLREDGTFVFAHRPLGDAGGALPEAVEWGAFAWDEHSGAFSITAMSLDSDGPAAGLSGLDIDLVSGAAGQLTFWTPQGPVHLEPVHWQQGSIVAPWLLQATPGRDTLLTFFDDGSYLLVHEDGQLPVDGDAGDALQWGEYSWQSSTGYLSFHRDGNDGIALYPVQVGLYQLDLQTPFGDAELLNLALDGDDEFTGTPGNDTFAGLGGVNVLHGGEGIDTAVYPDLRADHTLSPGPDGSLYEQTHFLKVTPTQGDTLDSIERLQFADAKVAIDTWPGGHAGIAARALGAVFGPDAVDQPAYTGAALALLDGGMTELQLLQLGIELRLGAEPPHAAVIDLLYSNVVGYLPGGAEREQMVGLLDAGVYSLAEAGVLFAHSPANELRVDTYGLDYHGLLYV